jgi:8-oxo-dGTP pyrophosphatase MutT (NUDIX family)
MDATLRDSLQTAEISPVSGSHLSAAVALILGGSRDELLLIRRADDPRDPWSGQIALPGGRYEPDDADLLVTAIRETEEEVGIQLQPSDCLGKLSPARARNRAKLPEMWVTPFVFRAPGALPQVTANYEVAETIWIPLLDLLDPSKKDEVQLTHEGSTFRMPAVKLGDHKLWGLTYGIVSSLLELVVESTSE